MKRYAWVMFVEARPEERITVTTDPILARVVGQVAESPKVITLDPPE